MSRSSRIAKILLGILGIALVTSALYAFIGQYLNAKEPKGKLQNTVSMQDYQDYFDPFSGEQRRQFLYFDLLSEPYVSFSDSEGGSLYLAVEWEEDYSYVYVVRMSDEQFEQYRDIFEYTFSDDESLPASYGTIYGYPGAIDSEMRSMTISYFEDFWGESILNEENFYELVGEYYLDAVRMPADTAEERQGLDIVSAAILLVLGLLFLLAAFRRPRYSDIWTAESEE